MSLWARLRERVLHSARRAGWAGALGVALLVGAALVHVVGGAALEARREALGAERTRLLRADPAAVAVPDGATPAERLADFYRGFPPLRELPRALARIHAHADRHALDLERADYRSADEAGTPLVRVSVTVPVRGEFAAIYAWLSELLGDMPELALESLSVRRSDGEIAYVDAELRLALFVRRAP